MDNSLFKFLFYWVYSARTYRIIKSTVHKSNFNKIDYYTHVYDTYEIPTEKERFQYADKLLKIYSQASLVLTSRLHCILPSLGLGVPAIYFNQINDYELSACRKKGIVELFNKIDLSRSSVINNPFGKIKNISKIKNKTKFMKYAKELELTIKKFLYDKEK